MPPWGPSACHLDVNVLSINDEMSKGGLCPETVFDADLLLLLRFTPADTMRSLLLHKKSSDTQMRFITRWSHIINVL